jgi:hypothetical protein
LVLTDPWPDPWPDPWLESSFAFDSGPGEEGAAVVVSYPSPPQALNLGNRSQSEGEGEGSDSGGELPQATSTSITKIAAARLPQITEPSPPKQSFSASDRAVDQRMWPEALHVRVGVALDGRTL